MKTLTTEQIKARLDAGPVALFDVRGDLDYELGHIPGAKTAPMGSLVFRVASVMNPGSFVVLYSAGGECDAAVQAARRLEDLRMTNVHVYQGGVEAWTGAGLSLVESPNAKVQARGPVVECRPIVVDRARAYGGAFQGDPTDVAGAGG